MGHPSVSRRAVLRAAASLGLASLAGCSGNGETAETPTPSEDSVFQEITYEGPNLVVRLREDHEVTRLNLIAPDGSLFTQTSVATGVTKAALQILDIRPHGGGFDHYVPGQHELIATLGDRIESIVLDLQPALRILDITQYREGTSAASLGALAVTVENVGSAPTWIYDIETRDAPNTTANNDLATDSGLPQIATPEQTSELILAPGEKKTYVGTSTPLLFINQERQQCRGTYEITVLVGHAAGNPLEQRITAVVGGDVKPAGLLDAYACSDIQIDAIRGESR